MHRSGRFGQGTVVASLAQVTCRGVAKYSLAGVVDCFGSVWNVVCGSGKQNIMEVVSGV